MAEETYPQGLLYYKGHGWVRVEGEEAVLGITWFARLALPKVVHVKLPSVGALLAAGEPYAEIELGKAATYVWAPVNGEVIEVNSLLKDAPQTVSADCYGMGWLVRVRIGESARLEDLMDADAYVAFLDEA
jgi:glycine cleavage system H protein